MYLRALKRSVLGFFGDEMGVASIEYALIGALVSVGTIAALYTNGQELIDLFDVVAGETEPLPAAPPPR